MRARQHAQKHHGDKAWLRRNSALQNSTRRKAIRENGKVTKKRGTKNWNGNAAHTRNRTHIAVRPMVNWKRRTRFLLSTRIRGTHKERRIQTGRCTYVATWFPETEGRIKCKTSIDISLKHGKSLLEHCPRIISTWRHYIGWMGITWIDIQANNSPINYCRVWHLCKKLPSPFWALTPGE